MNPDHPHREPAGWTRRFDWLLIAVACGAPLLMGGRHPLGRLVFAGLCGLLAVVWCWLQRRRGAAVRRSGLELAFLAGLLLVLLQLTPLPNAWLLHLSPEHGANLPLWQDSTAAAELQLGHWSRLSLTPAATKQGLVLLLAYGLLFWVTLQRLQRWEDLERLLAVLAVAGVLMAVLGLAQRFAGNGKFLWLYAHPYRSAENAVKGPFANQNHFAHFLALTVGPLLYWLWRLGQAQPSRGPEEFARRPSVVPWLRLLQAGLLALLLAALLTFSRGGVLAVFGALAACAWLLYRSGQLDRRWLRFVWLAAVMIGGVLAVYGWKDLQGELVSLGANLREMSSARHALWMALGRAIPKYLLLGAGAGSHPEVYPQYMPEQYDVEFSHAENGYLQVLLETGIIGLVLVLWAAGAAVSWAWRARGLARQPQHAVAATALLGSFVASLGHSLADFVWYLPACMTLTLLQMAAACRLLQLVREEHAAQPLPAGVVRWRPPAWTAATILAAGATAWMISTAWPPARASRHWDRYLAISLEARKRDPEVSMRAPALRTMLLHLRRAAEAYPDSPRNQLRLATLHLKLFERNQQSAENPMPLPHLRAAATESGFESLEQQNQWLQRAVGENLENARAALHHARRALQLCPLQGDAYVFLSELEFLESQQSHRGPLIRQALQVRPHSGSVLFAVGSQLAMAGQTERAVPYWRAAFHRQREVRDLLIRQLTPLLAPDALLRMLQPDLESMRLIRAQYVVSGMPQQARYIARQMARRNESRANAATSMTAKVGFWRGAQIAWRQAGEHPRAVACGQQIIRHDPGQFKARRDLAASLLTLQDQQQALPHLLWCRQRRPQDEVVARLWQRLEQR